MAIPPRRNTPYTPKPHQRPGTQQVFASFGRAVFVVTRFSGSCDSAAVRPGGCTNRPGIELSAKPSGISGADPLKRVTPNEQGPGSDTRPRTAGGPSLWPTALSWHYFGRGGGATSGGLGALASRAATSFRKSPRLRIASNSGSCSSVRFDEPAVSASASAATARSANPLPSSAVTPEFGSALSFASRARARAFSNRVSMPEAGFLAHSSSARRRSAAAPSGCPARTRTPGGSCTAP